MMRFFGHDLVVASHHVVSGGFILVAFSLVVAGATGMLWVQTKTMGPTVEHLDIIANEDARTLICSAVCSDFERCF